MEGSLQRLLISSRSINKHGRHRQFLFLIGQFLKIFSSETTLRNEPKLCTVSKEKNFENQLIRNKNCLWRPCLLTDWDEMSNLYRGPYKDASNQVTVHLAKRFQRRRISPLKPHSQMKRNLVGIIYGQSSIKNAHFVPIH
jgi:hypothetical protein